MNNPKQWLAFMFGLTASLGFPPPMLPPNDGNTPYKNINRMPHQGLRERARRIRQMNLSLQVAK